MKIEFVAILQKMGTPSGCECWGDRASERHSVCVWSETNFIGAIDFVVSD